jgi:hypothetical protein
MTIKFLCDYGKYKINNTVTLSAAEETSLVTSKVATTDLTGGIPYVEEDNSTYADNVKARINRSTNKIESLKNPDGTDLNFDKAKITNAQKIQTYFSDLARASNDRVNQAYLGHSIVAGTGSNNAIGYSGQAQVRTHSFSQVMSKALNAAVAGAWTPGVDFVASNTATFTVGGTASFSGAYASAGINGRVVSLGTNGTLTFTVSNHEANRVIRIFGYATSSVSPSTPVTARYALSGSNNQATTNAPASTGTDLWPSGASQWYEFNLTLGSAGTTTVVLSTPATTADAVGITGVDLNYKSTTAGLTVHRTAFPGAGVTEVAAWGLDNSDTQPNGNWAGSTLAHQQRRETVFQSLLTRLGITSGYASFDVNDIVKMTLLGYTAADIKRHIVNMITPLNAAGIPILAVLGVGYRSPADGNYPSNFTQDDVINIFKQVSDESPDLCGMAYIDLTKNLTGSVQQKYNKYWKQSSFAINGEVPALHPNAAFHAFMGKLLAGDILETFDQAFS